MKYDPRDELVHALQCHFNLVTIQMRGDSPDPQRLAEAIAWQERRIERAVAAL